MFKTIADDVLFSASNGLELRAFEYCVDNCRSTSEAHDHDVYRFEDGSEIKVFINEQHEITITP